MLGVCREAGVGVVGQVYRMSIEGREHFESENTCDLCQDRESLAWFFNIMRFDQDRNLWLHRECYTQIRDAAVKEGLVW